MDLRKAKIFLDKINREYARMSKDPENIMRIDVDIMLAYVRDLYESFLEDYPSAPTVSETPPGQHVPSAPARPASTASAPAVEPPSSAGRPPAPSASPSAPSMSEAVKHAEPLPPVAPKSPATPPPSFPAPPPEAEMLFEHKQATELSEKLSELPISDLRKAIGLNDKLLLTRELFGDDNAAFEKALNALNSFTSMDQAKAYLMEHCVMRYRWTDKKCADTAKKFIKLVRRRYV